MKMNNCLGDGNDISGKKKALLTASVTGDEYILLEVFRLSQNVHAVRAHSCSASQVA